MNIGDVVHFYHDLLVNQPDIAEEADSHMRARLRERNLYFGDRPLCRVLRPYFYTLDDWRFVQEGLEGLLSAFSRLHEVCISESVYRAQLKLDDYEENLYPLDAGGPVPWTSSRLDTFFVVDERILKCVEYNAETPAGIGYGDVLNEVFDELEPMKRLRRQYNLQSMAGMNNLLAAILDAYRIWGGREKPKVAILDWREVPTLNEHEITREHFERHGIATRLADPRALEYRNGHLWADDFRIDIIYKRVLYSELIERMGMDNPVVKALRDRAVFITNSPSAKLMAKKASLAFLSDEKNTGLFSTAQQAAINAHIPWTRVVEERKTFYNGEQVDLLPFAADHREQLVLKPNDEYGGRGVILGWECSPENWQESLQQALNTPHVVQERVPIVQRSFPMWENGALDISPRYVDADPYVFNGNTVHGCLTRLSPVALLNVTAGGGSAVPAFIISEA